jgi:hypothetical protein
VRRAEGALRGQCEDAVSAIRIGRITDPKTRAAFDFLCRRRGTNLHRIEVEAQALTEWIDRETEKARGKKREG